MIIMKFTPMSRLLATLSLTAAMAQAALATDFHNCIQNLQGAAQAAGVSKATFEKHTQGLQPDSTVLQKLDYQPEFKMAVWDYLAGLVDEERVADGKQGLAQHAETLKKVSEKYGVDAATVVAVWGVESNFGRAQGKYQLTQALGTLACMGRRQAFFRGEFFSALRILQGGHFAPEKLVGSWAGAFGQTQFMPSTFERLAVDFDGDGRKDLIDSAADALGSTANFLKQGGWQSSEPWGFEVKLPDGFNAALIGRKLRKPVADWGRLGVARISSQSGGALTGAGITANTSAALLAPAGVAGPVFLVFKNFDVIYGYNASESYGLAIAHLSDRLRGGGAFVTAWPTDDPGLSRAERRELQTLLANRGHDVGEIDGMLGEKSRAAIEKEQARLGQKVSGRAGVKLLAALR
jgi:lytic murein transglycosylase